MQSDLTAIERKEGNSAKNAAAALETAAIRHAAQARALSIEGEDAEHIRSGIEISTHNQIMASLNRGHQKRSALLVGQNVYRLNYIYLGDIIAAASSILVENGYPERLKILLGQFDYEIPMAGQGEDKIVKIIYGNLFQNINSLLTERITSIRTVLETQLFLKKKIIH